MLEAAGEPAFAASVPAAMERLHGAGAGDGWSARGVPIKPLLRALDRAKGGADGTGAMTLSSFVEAAGDQGLLVTKPS